MLCKQVPSNKKAYGINVAAPSHKKFPVADGTCSMTQAVPLNVLRESKWEELSISSEGV